MSGSFLCWGAQNWECQIDGKNHFTGPTGDAFPNAAQDAGGLLCCKGALPAHGQLVVHQDGQDLLCGDDFQLWGPQQGLVPKDALNLSQLLIYHSNHMGEATLVHPEVRLMGSGSDLVPTTLQWYVAFFTSSLNRAALVFSSSFRRTSLICWVHAYHH